MKLHFKKTGEGKPFIILHGLFGSGDNWMTFARALAEEGYSVYQVDLRNHGHSPHAALHNNKEMSQDVFELIQSNNLKDVVVLGHSMGGKVAMQLAIDHRESIASLIVVDILPHYYPVHHRTILDALLSVDIDHVQSRDEAEQQLGINIKEQSARQFLMKNLYRKEDKHFGWRFNLTVLNEQIESVGEAVESSIAVDLHVLFIKGGDSNYIKEGELIDSKKIFPKAELAIIENAGHWVHADQPVKLLEVVMNFLHRQE